MITRLLLAAALLFAPIQAWAAQTTTLTISGQNGTVISGLKISTTSGPCINITGSQNITIKNSDIGPCGTNLTVADSRGIMIQNNSSNIHIYDNYIHVENFASSCSDVSHANIYVKNDTGPVDIQGNVIAYGEKNIAMTEAANVSVIGNFLLNARGNNDPNCGSNWVGHQIVAWSAAATTHQPGIVYRNNYALSSQDTSRYKYVGNVSDALNVARVASPVIDGNYVDGTNCDSCCGIILDANITNGQITNNVVINSAHGGICSTDGASHTISGNKVYDPTPTSPNAFGMAIAWYGTEPSCAVTLTNNIVAGKRPPPPYTWSSWYAVQGAKPYCPSITQSGNTIDAAAEALLTPVATKLPPPPIPPSPKNCVARSPYTNATGGCLCPAAT